MAPLHPADLCPLRTTRRFGTKTLLGLATGLLLLSAPDPANAYPMRDELRELYQPDGAPVWVVLNGDEFYMRAESPDGYALVMDPASGYIMYGRSDGQGDLVPTGIIYGATGASTTGGVPASVRRALDAMGVARGLRRSPGRIAALHAAARQQVAPNSGRGSITALPGGQRSIVAPLPQLYPAPPTGSVTGLVVAVDFSDRPATVSLEELEAAFNGDNYGSTWHGSIRNWSEVISYGQTSVSHLVAGYYQAAYPTEHYRVGGEWDYSASEELYEEVYAYIEDTVDLSSIAVDGELMSLALLYAGDIISNGWASALWPHGGCGGWGYRTSEGVRISNCYLTNLGDAVPLRLSTHRHELGHSFFDWPDTYDYDDDSQSGGGYATETDLPCAPFRMWAGWLNVFNVTDAPGLYTLEPNGDSCLLYENVDNDEEYFVAEYMVEDEMRPDAPDEGLLVWHVDEAGDNSWQDMTPSRHYELSVEQADGNFDLENNSRNRDGDLFHAGYVDRFDETTTPDSDWWNGNESGFRLCDISGLDATMTVNVGCEPVVGSGGAGGGLGGAAGEGGADSGTGGAPASGGAIATGGTPGSGGTGTCIDTDANCSAWAAAGECTANPDYMLTNCCASCEALNGTGGSVGSGGAGTGGDLGSGGTGTGGYLGSGGTGTGGALGSGGSGTGGFTVGMGGTGMGGVPVGMGGTGTGGVVGGMGGTGTGGIAVGSGGLGSAIGGAMATGGVGVAFGGAWMTGGSSGYGVAPESASEADEPGGCGCRTAGTSHGRGHAALLALLGLVGFAGARRRRRGTPRAT